MTLSILLLLHHLLLLSVPHHNRASDSDVQTATVLHFNINHRIALLQHLPRQANIFRAEQIDRTFWMDELPERFGGYVTFHANEDTFHRPCGEEGIECFMAL